MEIIEIHKQLTKQCPTEYTINEIIKFSYPYRRVIVNATINKSPEESIKQIYSVMLRAILMGYNTDLKLTSFLGLQDEDFLLRDLYLLREKGFIDFSSNEWNLTEQGKDFITDNNILRILEDEDFEFLIDARTGQILEKEFKLYTNPSIDNDLEPIIKNPIKDPNLLNSKHEAISDLYKRINSNLAYLIDYDKDNIRFDKKEKNDYCLIEYISRSENNLEPYIEIRKIDKDLSKEKRLTSLLSQDYPEIVYQLSDTDRGIIRSFPILSNNIVAESTQSLQTLSVWQTQDKFKEALETFNKRILIESPWIKKAILKYIPIIEQKLKQGKDVYILYGIDHTNIHHAKSIKQVQRLNSDYENMHLINLPDHFKNSNIQNMTGTHRKLIIKDYEYFLVGSFNFLSFNKVEGEKVANEESILINSNVENKWKSTLHDYGLNSYMKEKTT